MSGRARVGVFVGCLHILCHKQGLLGPIGTTVASRGSRDDCGGILHSSSTIQSKAADKKRQAYAQTKKRGVGKVFIRTFETLGMRSHPRNSPPVSPTHSAPLKSPHTLRSRIFRCNQTASENRLASMAGIIHHLYHALSAVPATVHSVEQPKVGRLTRLQGERRRNAANSGLCPGRYGFLHA